jgi:tetratricopeptide (TPR) repeat protein
MHAKTTVISRFDWISFATIACLILLTPLAIGSVDPWPLCIVEIVIFLLTIVLAMRLAVERTPRPFPGLRGLLLPAAAFIALIIFQLLPMPPAMIRVISPTTYKLYATSLPGWPQQTPYRGDRNVRSASDSSTPKQDYAAAAARNHLANAGHTQILDVWDRTVPRWRPLSIAPVMTKSAALEFIAYACLFFIVLCYPLRRYPQQNGERRFWRRVLKVVLASGLIVGCIGLLQMTLWNGKVLWFYTPYDWGHPRPDVIGRAQGPFVDPDHFAAYLNLILPLALAAAACETFLSRRRLAVPLNSLRVFCLAIASVLTAAIVLSLSRGGWIAASISGTVVLWFVLRSTLQTPAAGRWSRLRSLSYVAAIVGLIAVCALYTAPSAPGAVNARLEQTINEPDFGSRIGFWKDTLGLIRDFPLLGVGMGCFEDVFPGYQSPPWSPITVREAHNDYLELIADVGIAGFALLLWFCIAAGVRIYRGLGTAPREILPVLVGLIGAIVAMGFQEAVDFPLQIPANAILFTIILAMTLRLAGAAARDSSAHEHASGRVGKFALLIGVAAVVLIVISLEQDKNPYPYLNAPVRDASTARALILAHPARSAPHIWYGALGAGSAGEKVRELKIAAALDPINPVVLDLYAQALAGNGQMKSALAELTRSVFVHPAMSEHFYLQPDMIPWLSMEERDAIDRGLRMAMADNFDGAVAAFAAYSDALHRDASEADALARASASAGQPARQAQLLIDAGMAYERADDTVQAVAAFKKAAAVDPSNPKPYGYLADQIFAPRKDIDAAKAAVQAGLKNGADPSALYIALAQAYEQAGDYNDAEAALVQAIQARPDGRYDFDTLRKLADLETRANHFDRAVFWMRKAIEVRPNAADALYELALTEESDYEYAAALRDLDKALALQPGNVEMRSHRRELMRTIAAYSDHPHH